MARQDVGLVTVAGDDIHYWWASRPSPVDPARRPVAFTEEMTSELGRLCAAVIGISGTGSVVAEQLARLGFGRVVPIDFDRVERRNVNRILNTTLADAEMGRAKVEVFADSVARHRVGDVAVPVAATVLSREAVLAASQCDVLFGCVDTLEARQVADCIAAAFLVPLFDIGVTIPARRAGSGIAISDVCGRIDHVLPGGFNLGDRGVYDPARLRAESLRAAAPDAHAAEVAAGYFQGVAVEAPSVITLNMRAASAGVGEFLARAYPFPFRGEPPLRPHAVQPRRVRRGTRSRGRLRARHRPRPRARKPGAAARVARARPAAPRGRRTVRLPRWLRQAWERIASPRRLQVFEGDSLPRRLPRRDLVTPVNVVEIA